MLGTVSGRRRCPWLSGTCSSLAAMLRSNTHIQPNFRIPLSASTTECQGSCLQGDSSRDEDGDLPVGGAESVTGKRSKADARKPRERKPPREGEGGKKSRWAATKSSSINSIPAAGRGQWEEQRSSTGDSLGAALMTGRLAGTGNAGAGDGCVGDDEGGGGDVSRAYGSGNAKEGGWDDVWCLIQRLELAAEERSASASAKPHQRLTVLEAVRMCLAGTTPKP